MKVIVPLFVFLLVSACAHQPRKVECNAHLTPINPPTPVVKTAAPPAAAPSAP
jgi:hypothetical protein